MRGSRACSATSAAARLACGSSASWDSLMAGGFLEAGEGDAGAVAQRPEREGVGVLAADLVAGVLIPGPRHDRVDGVGVAQGAGAGVELRVPLGEGAHAGLTSPSRRTNRRLSSVRTDT